MKRTLKILYSMAKHPIASWKLRRVRRTFKEKNVDIYDKDGNMKNLLTVLEELADQWASVECEDDE